jgi:crotonobetainyl-CoA:carnitine CoA-transferase CaiB-like acyl-CoA transferase
MEQSVKTATGDIITTRCPIRINGKKIVSNQAAPQLGEHNQKIYQDLINS